MRASVPVLADEDLLKEATPWLAGHAGLRHNWMGHLRRRRAALHNRLRSMTAPAVASSSLAAKAGPDHAGDVRVQQEPQ